MTVVTTRPSSTLANGNSTLVGAATRHAALSDNSDASYVELIDPGTSFCTVQFANPVDPGGGAIFKDWKIRVRGGRAGSGIFCIMISTAPVYDLGSEIETSTNFAIPTTITRANPDPHHLAVPNTFQLSMKKKTGPTGDQEPRIYELYLDSIYVAKPVAAVTAPTGTVTNTNRPTVTWTQTLDSEGGAQTKYWVKVFNAAQYGAGGFNPETSTATYDSGEKSGAVISHAVANNLINATYRAYVKIAQTVNGVDHWGDWVFGGFVINVALPSQPQSGFVTAEPQFGRVKITLIDTPGGSATTDYWYVVRVLPGGVERPVRTLREDNFTPISQPVIYDYEGHGGLYRAWGIHDYNGFYAFSGGGTEASASWSSGDWWVKHPHRPELNRVVTVRSQPGLTKATRQGIHQVLGAESPTVISGGPVLPNGEIAFRVESDADRDALMDLLTEGEPVLIQAPNSLLEEVYDWPDRWCSVGDLSRERAVDWARMKYTFDGVPWQEVERPSGVIVSWLNPVPAGDEGDEEMMLL